MGVDPTKVRVEWAYPDYDVDISDPRGEGGGAGWVPQESTGKTYKRREYKIPALEYTLNGKPGPYMVFDTSVVEEPTYKGKVSTRRLYPLRNEIELEVGLQAGSNSVAIKAEWVSPTGSPVHVEGTTITVQPGAAGTATAAGWTKLHIKATQPTGSATPIYAMRFYLEGRAVYAVRNVRIHDNGTVAPQAPLDETFFTSRGYSIPTNALRANWYDATSLCTAIGIRRGCRPNPPVEQLEIGTGTIRFKTAPANPDAATYGPISRGYRVRVSGWNGTEWESVFEGRLDKLVPVQKVGDSPGYMEWQVVDRVADLTTRTAPGIVEYSAATKLESILNPQTNGVLYNPSIRVQNDNGYFHGYEYYDTKQEAIRLDHMLTVRNDDYGLLWCDKENQLQYVSGASGIPDVRSRPTKVFRTQNPGAGEFSPVLAGWDREQQNPYRLNTMSITRLWKDLTAAGQPDYSPSSRWYYREEAYLYGPRQASINFLSKDSADTPKVVRHWVYAFGQYEFALNQFQFNATNNVAVACTTDIYDNVQVHVAEAPSLPTNYRIIGLEHDIRPDGWHMRYHVRVKERRYTGTPAMAEPQYEAGEP